MAMNSTFRGIAASTNRSVRPVYEDFRPLMEPKEDPQAKIVNIHLPGFQKEQVRIVAESGRRVLRIRGERLVAGNKWIRFLEEVTVPENCEMAGTTAKLEGEYLRIFMPRKMASAPQIEALIPEIPHPMTRDDDKQVAQTLYREEAGRRKGAIEDQKQRIRTEIPGEESAEKNNTKAVKGMYVTERRMLVNVGVAALVIVALGGWISYSISSSASSSI